MPDISLIAIIGAAPMSGIVCSAYKASRFGSLPVAYDTAVPGGAADATATSGSAFGGPGRVSLAVPTFEEYWIAVPSGGHIGWVEAPLEAVSAIDSAALALKAPVASPAFTGVVTIPSLFSFNMDAKPSGDGQPGTPFDWRHNDSFGYLMHLASGATMSGGALIGLGVGDTGNANAGIIGLLVSNKLKGWGVWLDNLSTITSATAYGLIGRQASMAPLLYLETLLGAVAPVLRLESNASPGPGAGDVLEDWYGGGHVLMGEVVCDAASPNKLNFVWSGGAIIGSEFRGLPMRSGDALSASGNTLTPYDAATAGMVFNTQSFGSDADGKYTFKVDGTTVVTFDRYGHGTFSAGLTSTLPAFVAADKYVTVDASGNFHKSAIGPAS